MRTIRRLTVTIALLGALLAYSGSALAKQITCTTRCYFGACYTTCY